MRIQIRWVGISHLKPLKRYLRYFRGTHWRSSLSRRLLAFYTWMNRATDCLYAAQCRSRGIGEWLKRLFCGHGRSCPPSSDSYGTVNCKNATLDPAFQPFLRNLLRITILFSIIQNAANGDGWWLLLAIRRLRCAIVRFGRLQLKSFYKMEIDQC